MEKHIVFIIDKSGSMKGSEVKVVTGYNELLEEQKAEPGKMLLTTIFFNTTAVTLHNCVDVKDAGLLSLADYVPSGGTALLDTVGDALTAIKEGNSSEGGLLVIVSDGKENASRRFTYERVKQLLKEIEGNGWRVLYIGADLRDFSDADLLGLHREQRMSIAKENLSPAMKNISSGIKELRKGNPMGAYSASTDKLFDRTLPYKSTIQGWAIIDSGSPVSFGDINVFMMGRDRHPVSRNPLTEEIRRHVGMDVAAVIGMDILRQYDLRIDYIPEDSEYLVSHYHTPQSGMEHGIPLRHQMGIPVVDAAVNGAVVPMFVDTGSHHTFIDKTLIKGSELSTVRDFYPGLGTFESPTYHTKLSLCGRDFTITAAVLPRALEYLLLYSGVKGIIGMDVLKQQGTWLGFFSGVLAFDASGC